MRNTAAGVIVLCAVMLLAGCKGDTRPPDPLQSQRQAIDQSKGVEHVLDQSAASRRADEGQSK